MQNGNTVCLYNRANLFRPVGFETTNLLQLNYFDKRNFRYCKLVLVVLDTVAQRFGKTTFIVRYKPYKGMRIKKISHNSKPNGSGTSSLYLVSFTSFLGTGLKSLLSIFLDFLVLTDVVFILQFLFSNCNVNIIYLHNQCFEVFFKKKPPTGGIISNFPQPPAETLPCGALVCATAHAPHCNVSAALRVLGGEQKISSGTGKQRERIARSNGSSSPRSKRQNRSRGSTRSWHS